MQVLIFKTDIKTKKKVNAVKPVLNGHPAIYGWSVDTQDIDNVLRIEASGKLKESDVINMVAPCGFSCEVLPD